MLNTLITEYNIVPNKTLNTNFTFPLNKIPTVFLGAFVRGFIDGDGSIGNKHFSMVCNSPKFAEQIKNKFLEVIPELKWVIYKETRKTIPYWSLHFSFNIKVRKPIYNYLYNNATIFLKRKRDKALNAVLNAVDKRTAQCRA